MVDLVRKRSAVCRDNVLEQAQVQIGHVCLLVVQG